MYMIISALVGLVSGIFIGAIVCYTWWRCTIKLIKFTYSESMKISNSGIPMDTPSIYDSQSLHILPDIYSTYRPRTNSFNESYSKDSSPHNFLDSSNSNTPIFSGFIHSYPPLHEELIDSH